MGNLGHLGGLKDHEWVGNERSQNLQWAQGKAGEDRLHVVVSEEHGWVFVGISDGFNGPDALDFLLSNMYQAVLGKTPIQRTLPANGQR
ncbi:putative protein phosphatase 2C 23 [Artemisia annua]|uniref:PPM-type phosphatase domain-containing protein n=1 Tax=Artemisia annua TaxID=35608 RepID=A0A2U1KN82_ARTAN|nr:putative protein phosphatase 2C 23 [Artemisia annua]